ncbi:MAG: choice-of-anchor A family protein [Ignavibacteria bacterium]|nr:choice-of-anchor A family protein [Ignavibacteria bacterium]
MKTAKTLINSAILVILFTFVSVGNLQAQGSCNLNGFMTYTQGGWGSPSNSTPGGIRDAYFNAVFPSGAVMGGNFTASFTSASAVKDFLPQGGTSAAFNANYSNPTSTSAGVLGGQVMALLLNVKYDEAGYLGTNPLKLKDLVITTGTFAGKTVSEFLAIANTKIGGGSSPYTFSQINDAATSINENFDNGTVNQNFLTCPTTPPAPASLGDKVWNDANQNGIQDNGEAGIANVTVKLYTSANVLVGTTTTDANGNYSFTNLSAGTYFVEFTKPSGYTASPKDAGSDDTKDSDADVTTGKTGNYTLVAGQNNITVDAGFYVTPPAPASLGDKVWNDANHNGIQDNGEAGISNVTVKLYTCDDNLVATTSTDASGNYLFSNVQPGSYYVKFSQVTGFIFTTKDAGSDDALDSDADPSNGKTACFTLAAGENKTTVDAGLYVNFITIGDKVWKDLNNDGIQDANEPGIPGVTVKLYDCNNTLITTTVTDANGIYQFCCSIGGGSYYVEFVLPSGYVFSPKDAGSDDTKDSDADVTTGKTACFNISGGQTNLTLDAGINQLPVNIGDKVWNDIDKDGVQDNGEAGIPNVTVKLYNCLGVLVSTTTTDANGLYHFNNIPAGDYYVEFTAPSGYVFSPQNQGSDDNADSDVDPLTGKTACKTFVGGTTDNLNDAGLYYGAADLQITKTVNSSTLTCGQSLTYTITVTNNGPADAGSITVSDILPAGLLYVSATASQGAYTSGTGNWTVGTLTNGSSATLTIDVTVDCSAMNNANIDLGPARPYNVFVLENIIQPSADTEGKLAVGGNANLSNYSVGDKLPNSNGAEDVLVVGGNLYYTSGRVYNGNVAYGGLTNLPISAVSIDEGTLRHDASVIDFAAAKTHLENLSTQLSGYAVNGTTTFQWGTVNLTHNDPYLNVFTVNGSDLNAAHTFEINVPNGSAVVVNILGTTINWHGGLFVNGTAMNNVLYNFPQATSLTISGIDVKGSVLAPLAALNFPAGIITGQTIVKSMTGSGQFNLAPFLGNIPANQSIVNVASITGSNISDLNTANNTASAVANFPSNGGGSGGGTGGGSGSGNWQQIGNIPSGQVVTCLESDNLGNIYAGTASGYIYKRTGNNPNWVHVNPLVYSGAVWAIETHPNGTLLAGTVTGVYIGTNNGTAWTLSTLQYKDVRTIRIDALGNVFAGTWGQGMYVSNNCGLTWTQSNTGLGTHLIVTGITVTANNTVFVGTFDGGVFKSVDHGASWVSQTVGYNYIWAMASNSNGDIFAGTYGDGLYRSTNGGTSWTKTSFPGTYVYELRIDAADNVFGASYSGGVFASTNNGNTWSSIGMGGFGLSSLLIVSNGSTPDGMGTGKIYTGTANGSIYMAVSGVTDVKSEKTEIPTQFNLSQNYPNPFNPSTRINVSIPKDGFYEVSVFSITGELVAKLAAEQLTAGVHSLDFNASNLPSGIYIYRLTGNDVSITRKMTLMK